MEQIKTPVRYCAEDWMIFDADDQWIASLDAGDVGPEIVRRINAYPALLAACKHMANDGRFYKFNRDESYTCLACGASGDIPRSIQHEEWCIINEALVAIAQAKGETEGAQ